MSFDVNPYLLRGFGGNMARSITLRLPAKTLGSIPGCVKINNPGNEMHLEIGL
jgi:hypothetical protein